MPQGGAWSNSNKSQMLSSFRTDINQGGGNKKAGFPGLVGRESWTNIFLRAVEPINGRCCNRGKIATTMVFTRNTIRPISGDSRIPMR
jgi:hypothetical protein